MIQAITFDLWDNLVVDDSDEEVRAARGLLSKADQRRKLFVDEVLAHHDLPAEVVNAAFDTMNDRFRHQWKVQHVTPHIRERLSEGFVSLGLDLTPGFPALVHAYSTMEVEIPPRPTDGVRVALEALHGKYPLGIVSDAIVTPGDQLRELLKQHDLFRYFDHFVFSDEVGAAKPDPKVFHAAAAGLGVDVTAIVHIGDREANDIAGPLNAGARGILYTGAIDRGTEGTRAAAICRHMADLPGIIASLDGTAA